ncbi:endo-1,4-beta-xylanase [bacterium]|nr:endo-1,4-beta-xylanase [bacterium]
MNRWLWLSLLVLALGPLAAQESPNLLTNPGFVGDGNGDGLADNWEYQPGAAREKLDVSFGLESVAAGHFAQRLSCTRYESGHAMLCQTGVVKVEADHWYECRLRYRGEKLSTAYVGLHDTNGWKQLGLWQSFSPRQSWRDLKAKFRADHTCSQTTRFQIWFTTTGTLWVSDLALREIPPPPRSNVIPDIGHRNLLPNGGFEALGGWGLANFWTYGWDVARGQGLEGSNCAAITWRPDDPQYGTYFDYFDPVAKPQEQPRLQTIGFVPIKPGETYTLSVYMKASKAGAPASIGLNGPGLWGEKKLSVTTDWQRYSFTARASADLAVPQIGPTFTAENRADFAGTVVYLDGAQLEVGAAPTDFAARPLEVLARPFWHSCGTPVPAKVAFSADVVSAAPTPATVLFQASGFSDEPVVEETKQLTLKTGANAVPWEAPLPGPGFYRVKVSVKSPGATTETSVRGAVCLTPPNPANSAFGINHAYAHNGQLELVKQLGVSWVRDWSLKWDHVEPEQGRFTFDAVDFQINRPLKLGMNVLCMFPFPSAEWCSTAPAELKKTGYPGNRIRQAYVPSDLPALEAYAAACVERYQDRIRYWEVFNESIFTNYSLPKSAGYKPEDYVSLLQRVYAGCKRADPTCHVIGGYSAMPDMFPLYQAMFDQGGLRSCDEVSLHWYPGGAPEGVAADLQRLNGMAQAQGGTRPYWMTEFAYYADDDPDPIKRNWPNLLESEWLQAVWNTRACVLMLAGGVEKIFYHIWTTRLNYDIGSTIFFEYAGAPHKIAVTQAAMAYLLGERPKCVSSDLKLGEDVRGCLFEAPRHLRLTGRPARHVAVVWAEGDGHQMHVPDWSRAYDICGAEWGYKSFELGETPFYLVLPDATPEGAAQTLRSHL